MTKLGGGEAPDLANADSHHSQEEVSSDSAVDVDHIGCSNLQFCLGSDNCFNGKAFSRLKR